MGLQKGTNTEREVEGIWSAHQTATLFSHFEGYSDPISVLKGEAKEAALLKILESPMEAGLKPAKGKAKAEKARGEIP